jgi:putative transposase
MDWARILAYITGTADRELLLRNVYLGAEIRTLKGQIKGRLLLCDIARATFVEIEHRLGRKALADAANAAKLDTIVGWYRSLIAGKFGGSKRRRYPGRPRVDGELEQLVVRIATESRDWGYGRIVGALANHGS